MILEQCKGVHCVDLGESFQTHIFLQNLGSIQLRTSNVKFACSPRTDPPGWARRQRRRRATGPTPLTRSTLAACLFPPVECREWFCPSSPSAGCNEAGDSHCCPSSGYAETKIIESNKGDADCRIFLSFRDCEHSQISSH